MTASTATSAATRTACDQPPIVEQSTRPWLWAGLLTGALTVPVLWVTLSRHYTNGSDWASIEMRTRDVFSAHPPVVGAYSRMGWSHPGPLLFYLLAVPYRLFGQDARAMQLGAILINVVVIALIVWLLSRRGRAPLAVGSVAVAATMWGLPADSLGDTWNATLAVLPFFLTIVACWSCVCGDRAAPIVGAGAYAVAAQAHVGFAFVAGPLVVATVLYVLFTPNLRQRLARRLAWAGALIALLSLPLLVDTLRDWPGNLVRLAQWSMADEAPKAGLGEGLDVIGRATSLTAVRDPRLPQYLGELVQPLPSGFLPGTLLVLLVVAMVVTWWRRWSNEGLLVGGLLWTWIVAFVAASNISGPSYSWLYLWVHPLMWLSWAAVALVAWRLLSASASVRIRPLVVPVAGAAAALVLIGLVVDHARRAVDGAYVWEELVAPIDEFAQAAETTVDHTAPVFLTFDGDAYLAHAVHAGLVNQLDQRGVDVAVVPEAASQFGSQRVIQGPPGTHLLVRAEGTTSPTPPGAIVVAVADEVPSGIRREMDQLTATLSAVLARAGQANRIPVLHTPLVSSVLEDAPSAVTAHASEIERLAELRAVTSPRFVLYSLPVDGA